VKEEGMKVRRGRSPLLKTLPPSPCGSAQLDTNWLYREEGFDLYSIIEY
jgi:hypothetical protein